VSGALVNFHVVLGGELSFHLPTRGFGGAFLDLIYMLVQKLQFLG
jgi:hypothetical protein